MSSNISASSEASKASFRGTFRNTPSIQQAHFPRRLTTGRVKDLSLETIHSLTQAVKGISKKVEEQTIDKRVSEILQNTNNSLAEFEKDLSLIGQISKAIEAGNGELCLKLALNLHVTSQDMLFDAIAVWHNMSDYNTDDMETLGKAAPLTIYSHYLISSSPQVLLDPAPPFIHNKASGLLDQLRQTLNDNILLTHLSRDLSLLQLMSESKSLSSDVLEHIFDRLDPITKDALVAQAKEKFGLDEATPLQKIIEKTLLPIPGEDTDLSLVHKIAMSRKQTIEGKITQDKKKQFLTLHGSNLLPHKALKRYYKALPQQVQLEADIPNPPYYGKGVRQKLYQFYGAHHEKSSGNTTFRVLAPCALSIDVIISSDDEKISTIIPMTKITEGNWELTTNAPSGTKYQYRIHGADEKVRIKADPYAQESKILETEDCTHQYSIVCNKDFEWTDASFMSSRQSNPEGPASIYEVHVGSWMVNKDGTKKNWKDLAYQLGNYCQEMNFSHIEIFGALAHPSERSWGYQPSGFFSVNDRLGSLQDFKYFINHMHEKGIKVILDWVPGHFATDEFSLKEFDGSHLYEHENRRRAYQPEWNVLTFDLDKKNIRDFLLSSANFFAEECHLDGLRVDAVSSMLYTNVGRAGDGLAHYKGKKNYYGDIHSDAKVFFRDLNSILHRHQGFETYAEESSGFDNLTTPIDVKDNAHPYSKRGLGFDKKWAMGAMNKSLMQFFKADPSSRGLDALTEGMKIDPEEHIVQVTSHDESANGKGSLRGSMAGDLHQKFASLRLYHAKVMSSPGAKLTMMGNEIGQEEEWSGRFERHLKGQEPGCSAMDWGALEAAWDGTNYAKATQEMVKDLNKIYLTHPALMHGNKGKDFKWIKADDTTNQVMSFHRTSEDNKRRVMCIQNYSDKDLKDYKIILPNAEYDPLNKKIRSLSVLFSTDEKKYGGKGREITPRLNQSTDEKNPASVCVNLPPSTAIILEEELSP